MFAPLKAWADGGQMLDVMNSQYTRALRDVNTSLDSFYVVVSARTGELSSDAHAISGLRLECRPAAEPGTYIENWDGPRQPFIHLAMPPPYSSPPPPSSPRAYGMQGRSSAAVGGISFAVAFGASTAVLAGAFLALRRPKGVRRGISAGGEETGEAAGLLLDDGARIEAAAVPGPLPDEVDEADAADCDVFLSYRRADYWLADTIYNKLQLGGLQVFKDVRGRMAGQPFGAELVRAVRATPVFAPMISLSSLQRMATAADAGAPADTTLCEAIVALYFRSTGNIRLIHPLLAGETPKLGLPGCIPGEERWVPLTKQPAYAQALAALPNAVPSATYAAVSASLLGAFGIALPAEYAALTVREIMLGRSPERGDASPDVGGVISGPDLFVLDCLAQDLGLYIDNRYTPPAVRAAAEAAAARRDK